MISIVDYGAGNLCSVERAFDAVGAEHERVSDSRSLQLASKIVLPGVGHFAQMIRELDRLQLRHPLIAQIAAGTPFLGVCLGLQALFEGSEEAPESRGLGTMPGQIRKFDDTQRIPHMGWNTLESKTDSGALRGTGKCPFVYFANSYYAPVVASTSAVCTHGVAFSAVIEHGNVWAVQFHPEKSGAVGLRIVHNFACL